MAQSLPLRIDRGYSRGLAGSTSKVMAQLAQSAVHENIAASLCRSDFKKREGDRKERIISELVGRLWYDCERRRMGKFLIRQPESRYFTAGWCLSVSGGPINQVQFEPRNPICRAETKSERLNIAIRLHETWRDQWAGAETTDCIFLFHVLTTPSSL